MTAIAPSSRLADAPAPTDAGTVIWKYEWSKTVTVFGFKIDLTVGVYVDYFPQTKSFDLRISAGVGGHAVSQRFPFQGKLDFTLPLPLGCSLTGGIQNFTVSGQMLSFDIVLAVHIPVVGTITVLSQPVTVRIPSDEELARLYLAPASSEEFQLRLAAFA
jgi:hypothetical protein